MFPTEKRTQMQKDHELFQANQVAIPILLSSTKKNLNPQPNFLNIQYIGNTSETMFPDGNGGFVKIRGLETTVSLEYREFLQEVKALGKWEEKRTVIYDTSVIVVPPAVSGIICGRAALDGEHPHVGMQETLIENEASVNNMLALFSFRGCLAGYKLSFDKARSEQYLSDIAAYAKAQEDAKLAAEQVTDPLPV